MTQRFLSSESSWLGVIAAAALLVSVSSCVLDYPSPGCGSHVSRHVRVQLNAPAPKSSTDMTWEMPGSRASTTPAHTATVALRRGYTEIARREVAFKSQGPTVCEFDVTDSDQPFDVVVWSAPAGSYSESDEGYLRLDQSLRPVITNVKELWVGKLEDVTDTAVTVQMTHATTEIIIVANDLDKLISDEIRQREHTVALIYYDPVPSAFHPTTLKSFDSKLWPNVSHKIRLTSDTLACDYIFVPDETDRIRVGLSVSNGESAVVSPVIDISIMAGRTTVVHGPFMTVNYDTPFEIDPGYDGEFNFRID